MTQIPSGNVRIRAIPSAGRIAQTRWRAIVKFRQAHNEASRVCTVDVPIVRSHQSAPLDNGMCATCQGRFG